MQTMKLGLAALLAALCAGVMGFAIQRGATCTVAAVDEWVSKRKARRLLAMAEASLWVAGGLALASAAGALHTVPAAYPLSGWVLLGSALLGLGAWVNRACVFGAIARLGSGEWAYAATPVGFYAGCLSVNALFSPPVPQPLAAASPVLQADAAVALLFIAFAAWRLLPALRAWAAQRRPQADAPARDLAQRLWSPHAATAVIGVTFVCILMLVGVWAYTDVLVQLAHGMSMTLALGVLCLAALYAGALLGGWTAGRWQHVPPSAGAIARCFGGGVLMAWGSLLIPGSNDGLILIGMPLLRPYAWVGIATMCATIAAAQLLRTRLAAPGSVRGWPEAAAPDHVPPLAGAERQPECAGGPLVSAGKRILDAQRAHFLAVLQVFGQQATAAGF